MKQMNEKKKEQNDTDDDVVWIEEIEVNFYHRTKAVRNVFFFVS